MAGHIAFGARTGGALILLGTLLLFLALFLSPSVGLFFKMVPSEVPGVIVSWLVRSLRSAPATSAGTRESGSRRC